MLREMVGEWSGTCRRQATRLWSLKHVDRTWTETACRCHWHVKQQVEDVVAACGFDDVLRHVVTLQQIIQVAVKLPSVDSGTVEIATDDEPLLGSYEMVQHVCELLAEEPRDSAGRSVDADNSCMHSRV